MKIFYILTILIFLISCTGYQTAKQIDSSISKYEEESFKVNLGDSKEKVLAILEPTQKYNKKWRKKPERFLNNDNSVIEIYYYRSDRTPDGISTDDEFTPYVFKDGKLIGIGWAVLGGPKTQGQAVDTIIIDKD